MRKGARKQQGQHSGSSTEAPPKPNLVELVGELEQSTEQFQDIVRRYPTEPATEENLPVRFPLNLRWRPRVGEGEPLGPAAEVIAWTDQLRAHLINLEQYFSDWQDRPEALERFPLAESAHSFRGYQGVPHDDLIRKLKEHRRRLLVEAEKQRVLLPQTLPGLLKQVRSDLGLSQHEAAGEVGVSPDTYKSWEQGRAFPRGINHSQIKRFLERVPAQAPQGAVSSGDPV